MNTFITTSLITGLSFLIYGIFYYVTGWHIHHRYDYIYLFMRFMGTLLSIGYIYYFYKKRKDPFIVVSIASSFFLNPFFKYRYMNMELINCMFASALLLITAKCYFTEKD